MGRQLLVCWVWSSDVCCEAWSRMIYLVLLFLFLLISEFVWMIMTRLKIFCDLLKKLVTLLHCRSIILGSRCIFADEKFFQYFSFLIWLFWTNYFVYFHQFYLNQNLFASNNKILRIVQNKHCVLTSPHPSPFSAYRGFPGCQHFSKTNKFLVNQGKTPINWNMF